MLNKGHGAKLPRKKQQAIAALLEYGTVKEAAQKIDIGSTTLFRWLQDDNFQKAYRAAKKRVVEHAISRLQKACSEAVDALWGVMMDPFCPATSRVTAAKTILEMSVKGVELDDLEARIEIIEENLNRK